MSYIQNVISSLLICSFIGVSLLAQDGQFPSIRINEFLASNGAVLLDGNQESSDWIELFSETRFSLDLGGMYLTDDANELTKWAFPAGTYIDPWDYLVVFASGKPDIAYPAIDPKGYLHTNFNLSAKGEYLALVASDGQTILQDFAPQYPSQWRDMSYGVYSSRVGNRVGYMSTPTPLGANSFGYESIVADVQCSHCRGYYTAPIEVSLRCDTPNATIVYTTNGDEPSTHTGKIYHAHTPIRISSTTCLRAVVTKPGWFSSRLMAQTYLFTADIVTQPATPAKVPQVWRGGFKADYAMDLDVVDHVLPGYSVESSFLSIPSICISMDQNDLFGEDNGIYYHSNQSGDAWERQGTAEWIEPGSDETNFSIDAGIAIHGASSRNHSFTPKHSFRLLFKNQFGPPKLSFPVFPDSVMDEFDTLILRACSTDSWAVNESSRHYGLPRWVRGEAQYLRDQWMRDTQLDLGHLSAHGRYVHLFLNGLYWGLYNLTERPNAAFQMSYLGGKKKDYDVIHDRDELSSGNRDAWFDMYALAAQGLASPAAYQFIQGNNPDGTLNPDYPNYLDIDALIDYIILHIYANAEDWPCHNFWAGRQRGMQSTGFRFYVWDQEISNNSLERTMTWCKCHTEVLPEELDDNAIASSRFARPGYLYGQLRENPEFRERFTNRIQTLMFDDGLLTPQACHERWMRRAREIDQAIVAESARWGDTKRSVPYTREKEWLAQQEWLRTTYWPQNHALALERFRNVGL